MAESADATDLKSVDGDIVRVRPPLAPPSSTQNISNGGFPALRIKTLGCMPLAQMNPPSGEIAHLLCSNVSDARISILAGQIAQSLIFIGPSTNNWSPMEQIIYTGLPS
jgi:hypothetical protein